MDLDYEKIGLKCGLEIHQQLNTKKLFCNCPSLLRQDEFDFTVKRKLHVVAGESGKVDAAAEYQASLRKNYKYQGYDSTCLVELDESPPREINKDALKIALQISILLNAKIFPIAQIMRKTVIDGSNTSGFQRTVLIARDGFFETSQGKVGVDTICLEEDSARIISEKNNEITYRLDRLGIPLIEIATSPEIKSPIQAKESALYLGSVLRSCNVKRGLGTIRQDVNVSIKNGKRIELKGVQNPELIKKSVEAEAKRQFDLIKSKKQFKSEVRKVLLNGESEFLRPMPGAARMYPETDLPLLKISRNLINEVKRSLSYLKSEERKLRKIGLEEDTIKLLFKKGKMNDFTEFVKVYNNPKLIGKIILNIPKEIAGHSNLSVVEVNKLFTKDLIIHILEKVKNKELLENQVKMVLEKYTKNNNLEKALKFEREDRSVVEEKIMKIIKEKPGLSEKAYMGLIMKEFHGKIDGKEAAEIFKKHLK
ncbi:MAG: Glu-tRNA(Gln) amidotransferase subunit GatE [Nanoarchaeota archaeon]|nr:Glu-tRNA(Gln) amidotransferase subunit GatE [Nanoarchaeota archaeon]